MKHPLCAGIVCGALLFSGCQSLNWTAKNKSPSHNSVAQAENVREIPWTWRKKKPAEAKTEMPPEFAQKMADAKRRSTSPKTADEWIAEGSEQEVARNFPAAKKAYDEALLIDPVNATAHHRLGILADMRQDFVVAQDHYEAALRQKPHDPNLLSDLGYSHHLRGNVQQSKRYLLQALDIERQHKQALKNLGTLYASQGWYEDAALAFRHYRSEAEAQQLLSQYFPNGRPTPEGDIALAGGQRTAPPMPPENEVDPNTLKAMSQQEIMQLMQRQKQAAQLEREQKLLAEMRPPLQSSPSQDLLASAAPPAGGPSRQGQPPVNAAQNPAWNQDAPVATTNRAQPSNGDPFADRSAFPTEGNTNPANSGPAPSQDMPFWNGAGVQQRPLAQTPPSNWPTNNAGNATAPPSQAPGWADGNSPHSNNAGRTVAQAGPDSFPNGMPAQEFARREGTPPGDPNGQFRNNNSQNLSRQAYQLGMSAGPGTMFPNVAGNAVGPMTPSADPPATGGPWSNSTAPGGYTEMKPSTGWDQPASSSENSPWQTAPINPTPQSPTENWNSPTSVPWPGNASVQPTSGNATASRNSAQPIPVISPGMSPWGNAAGSPRNEDSSNRSAAKTGSGVVPAWYDTRSNDPPLSTNSSRGTSSNATTVPQWPYAPR